jgi:Electron transfer DM13
MSFIHGCLMGKRQHNAVRKGESPMNKLWRGIAIFALGGMLGTGFGVAVGFFIFPYVFPPPAAAEQIADAERSILVASGSFIHANPSDPVHYGKGRISVYEHTVFLESDFEVGPGPAFHVYLVPKAPIRSSSDLKDVTFVDLGGLRAFKGSQRYPVPAGVDLKQYQSVIIWCERFGVLISPADMGSAGARSSGRSEFAHLESQPHQP